MNKEYEHLQLELNKLEFYIERRAISKFIHELKILSAYCQLNKDKLIKEIEGNNENVRNISE